MATPIAGDAPAAHLAQFDDKWTRASVSADEIYNDIPDGSYDAVIEDARITETAQTGRLVVIWRLRIQGPQAVNRVVTKSRVITENTIGYLREDLEKCRLQITRLSDLPARLRELAYRPVGLDKCTKDGRTNFHFRRGSARNSHNGLTDEMRF